MLIFSIFNSTIYAQKTELKTIPLSASNHDFGQSEYEKEVFTEIDKYIHDLDYNGYFVKRDSLTDYLNQIIKNIKPAYLDSFDIPIYVCKSPAINAGIYANGKLIINTGILTQLNNEAELAYILCHELVHFIHRHNLEQYKEFEEVKVRGRKGYRAFQNQYSHFSVSLEREADSLGFELFKHSKYNPYYASKAIDKLPRQDSFVHITWLAKFIYDFDPPPTHPKTDERVAFLKNKESALENKGYTGEDIYKRMTEGMIEINISLLRQGYNLLDLVDMIDTIQVRIDDHDSRFYRMLTIEKASVYQQIVSDPLKTGAELKQRQLNKERGKGIYMLFGPYKSFEEAKPELEKKAMSLANSMENDPDFGYKSFKIKGLLYYQQKDYENAKKYLENYIYSGKAIPDKRYINSLLKEINTPKK